MRLPRSAVLASTVAMLAIMGTGLPAAQAANAARAAKTPGWRVMRHIRTANTYLDGVAAVSRTSAWAVGETAAQGPIVYRYEGGHWHAIIRPGQDGAFAGSVVASSSANVWVGLDNIPAVDHWNGRQWKRISFKSIAEVDVSGVTTTGPRDVWVFTYNFGTNEETSHHFNGRTWKSRQLPAVIDSSGWSPVSESSPTSIWAWTYDTATSAWATLHYNGSAWKVVKVPGLGISSSDLAGEQILALSKTSVWATMSANVSGSKRRPILLHWTGRAWHRIGGNAAAGELTGPLASDGHGGVWVSEVTAYPHYHLVDYRAGKWSRRGVPGPAGLASDVTGLTLIPGTRSLLGTAIVNLGFGTTSGADILKYGP